MKSDRKTSIREKGNSLVTTDGKEEIRLNKYITEAGICSRREADHLIEAGKVFVDGRRASLGMKIQKGQRVQVGKKVISGRDEKVILAVYKPVGIVCTEEKRTKNNIIRYLDYPVRITYVGRLDKDSEGLLLMTNDGDIINKIMRAGNFHEKEYKVTVNKKITTEFIEKMSAGVHITDKEKNLDAVTRPCQVYQEGPYTFRIILTQGLNRQIRRMCDALGCQVKTLKRMRIMNIELGNMKPGQYRKLTEKELKELKDQIANSRSGPAEAEAGVRPEGNKAVGAQTGSRPEEK